MTRRHIEMTVLAGLVLILAAVLYFRNRPGVPGLPGVFAADTKFEPLDVQEPQLHIDQLQRLQKLEYSGTHRNIFVAAPPPPPVAIKREQRILPIGPQPPPPPPPLQIPAEFFGHATQSRTGKRVAFLSSGEEVYVVAEGDAFLGRFRLVHIGNDTAEFEEIATGRHATLTLTQAPDQGPN